MRMLMDVGNSHLTLGIWDGGEVIKKWRVSTLTLETEDQFFSIVSPLLDESRINKSIIKSVAIASVVPGKSQLFTNFSEKYFKTRPVFVEPLDGLDVQWKADNPEEIGPDRIANVIGAKDYYASNAIIVDFGTAVNIDVLYKNAFVGGAILPGINLSMQALFMNAAKIPPVDLFMEDHYLGTNTGDNLRIGLVNGKYYAIKGLTENIFSELGERLPVIGTGGFAKLFSFEGSFIETVDPDLTLKGVAGFQDRI